MLSMFLAILAEAQVLVNAKVNEKKTPGADGYDETYDEYGVLSKAGGAVEVVALAAAATMEAAAARAPRLRAPRPERPGPVAKRRLDLSTPSMQSPQSLPPAMDRPAPVRRRAQERQHGGVDGCDERDDDDHARRDPAPERAGGPPEGAGRRQGRGPVVRATVPPLDNTRLRTPGVAQRSVDEAPSARMANALVEHGRRRTICLSHTHKTTDAARGVSARRIAER